MDMHLIALAGPGTLTETPYVTLHRSVLKLHLSQHGIDIFLIGCSLITSRCGSNVNTLVVSSPVAAQSWCLDASFWQVAWYRNSGDTGGFWQKRQLMFASDGARIVATTGDLDGDGIPDLVPASYYDHSVTWFKNAGDGSSPAMMDAVTHAAFNAQERTSVYARRSNASQHSLANILSFNRSFSACTDCMTASVSSYFETRRPLPQGALLSDLHWDGDFDIVFAPSGDNIIAYFRNLGVDGAFCEIKNIVDNSAIGVRTVVSENFDSDGEARDVGDHRAR
eukprot:2410610-Pleurochrysis_carterae.AAC.1